MKIYFDNQCVNNRERAIIRLVIFIGPNAEKSP